jgi:hypothetical protein
MANAPHLAVMTGVVMPLIWEKMEARNFEFSETCQLDTTSANQKLLVVTPS